MEGGLTAGSPIEHAGYGIHESVVSRAEATAILAALSRAEVPRGKAGARHVLGVPAVRALAHESRLTALAALAVGGGAAPFRATLFDKSPDANWLVAWHQDTALPMRDRLDDPEWGPWSTKAGILYARAPVWALEQVVALRISLDDSTVLNGPLRVLPGTHREGVLSETRIAELANGIPAVDCVTEAGGVVAMRPLTVHASSKSVGGQPRRVLHIEYAARLELRPGAVLASV